MPILEKKKLEEAIAEDIKRAEERRQEVEDADWGDDEWKGGGRRDAASQWQTDLDLMKNARTSMFGARSEEYTDDVERRAADQRRKAEARRRVEAKLENARRKNAGGNAMSSLLDAIRKHERAIPDRTT